MFQFIKTEKAFTAIILGFILTMALCGGLYKHKLDLKKASDERRVAAGLISK
jgi:hypothetical protein